MASSSPKESDVSLPTSPESASHPTQAEEGANKAGMEDTEVPKSTAGTEPHAPSSPSTSASPVIEAASNSPSAPSNIDAIISGLRSSLASSQTLLSSQATRLSALSDLEEQHAQLKDKFAFLSAAKEAVEASLREEVRRREEAEERVEALRGQVEMARRGVMTLQKQEKERKRMSMMGAPAAMGLGLQTGGTAIGSGSGLGGASGAGAEEVLENPDKEKEEKLNRRTSMLVRGSSYTHRRISSHSEPDSPIATLLSTGAGVVVGGGGKADGSSVLSTSPSFSNGIPAAAIARPGLRELRLGTAATASASATSPNPGATLPSPIGFDDPYTQTQTSRSSLSPPPAGASGSGSPSKAIASARAESERLRTELAATTLRLAESEEARQASETVLKALREFISAGAGAEGGVVDLNDPLTMEELKGISLPPLPTDRDMDEPGYGGVPEQQSRKTNGGAGGASGTGWGFKLWNAKPPTSGGLVPPIPPSPAPSSQAVEPPFTPHLTSPPHSVRSQADSTPRASPLPGVSELPLNEAAVDRVPAQTPLASFVSSWTKSVPPGTPAPATATATGLAGTPGTGAGAPAPSVARSFSSFFRKGTAPTFTGSGTAAAAHAGKEKEKELPPNPIPLETPSEAESEAGSIGAEREREMDVKPDVVEESEEAGLTAPVLGLEPSPVIREASNEQDEVIDQAVAEASKVESTSGSPAGATIADADVEVKQ